MNKKIILILIFVLGILLTVKVFSGEWNYYVNDHLGSTRVILNESGAVKQYYDYDPFGKTLRESIAGTEKAKYRFTGKELDEEAVYTDRGLDWYYFGARFYDPNIGRFLTRDPMAEKYPSWSPYVYTADNPLKFIDLHGMDWYDFGDSTGANIQWREGSEPQLKPGNEEYVTSLGKNILVAIGSFNEKVNEAIFELYLETNKERPIAIAKGNTIPSDITKFATIEPGLYSAVLDEFHGNPALLLNNGGKIPTSGINPNPESVFYGEKFANGILVHIGNTKREAMLTWERDPISAGCQTIWHGAPEKYSLFMKNFTPSWIGNYYLIRR